eukprot:1159936-Pelagomonas_calceolata.AAC.10
MMADQLSKTWSNLTCRAARTAKHRQAKTILCKSHKAFARAASCFCCCLVGCSSQEWCLPSMQTNKVPVESYELYVINSSVPLQTPILELQHPADDGVAPHKGELGIEVLCGLRLFLSQHLNEKETGMVPAY